MQELLKRLKEPSTWVSIAVLASIIFQFDLSGELQEHIVTAGIAVAALLGALLKENASQD